MTTIWLRYCWCCCRFVAILMIINSVWIVSIFSFHLFPVCVFDWFFFLLFMTKNLDWIGWLFENLVEAVVATVYSFSMRKICVCVFMTQIFAVWVIQAGILQYDSHFHSTIAIEKNFFLQFSQLYTSRRMFLCFWSVNIESNIALFYKYAYLDLRYCCLFAHFLISNFIIIEQSMVSAHYDEPMHKLISCGAKLLRI